LAGVMLLTRALRPGYTAPIGEADDAQRAVHMAVTKP
jgi:hypothetical protein